MQVRYSILIVLYIQSTASGLAEQNSQSLHNAINAEQQTSCNSLDRQQAVDQHVQVLEPHEYKELLQATTGNFFSIGVEFCHKKRDDSGLTIFSIRSDSPAQEAGLQSGDTITALNGKTVTHMSTQDCTDVLDKACDSSAIEVAFKRESVHKTVLIELKSLSGDCFACYLSKQQILYCACSFFSHATPKLVARALEKGLAKKPKGIIIDVRNNPGGAIQSALECISLFVAKNSLVATLKDHNKRIINRFYTPHRPLIQHPIPIIILINNKTASCGELFAYTLAVYSKNHKRTSPYIFTLGTSTFGKGTVQEIKPIKNGSALKITVGHYFLADGTSLEGNGLMPDFVIKKLEYPEKAESKKSVMNKKKMISHRHYTIARDSQIAAACNIIELCNLSDKCISREQCTHKKTLSWIHEHYTTQKTLLAEQILLDSK